MSQVIKQEDLIELRLLRDKLRRARKEYRSKRFRLLEALQAGATVEKGHYVLETVVRCVLQLQ